MTKQEFQVGRYDDAIHGEGGAGVEVAANGYRFRRLDGVVMPPYITPKRYQNSRCAPLRPTDVVYTSYPKSGSTWLSYILLLGLHGGVAPTSSKSLRSSLHWLASGWTYPRTLPEFAAASDPRIVKSHMPYSMAVGGMPSEQVARYVYIARNPKDVAVSYFHFESGKSWAGDFRPQWSEWLDMFLDGSLQRGCWFRHVRSWWDQRTASNILFLKYEDLITDFKGTVSQLFEHLDVPVTSELLSKIQHETSFDVMRATGFSSLSDVQEFDKFFRRGAIGSWKERFSPADIRRFNDTYAQRMAGTGLEFGD